MCVVIRHAFVGGPKIGADTAVLVVGDKIIHRRVIERDVDIIVITGPDVIGELDDILHFVQKLCPQQSKVIVIPELQDSIGKICKVAENKHLGCLPVTFSISMTSNLFLSGVAVRIPG